MNKRLLIMIMSLLFVLVACNSTAGTEDDGKSSDSNTLNVSIVEDAGTLDPGVSMDNSAWKITYNAYERLVQYDGEKTTVKPSLAKDWEISDDGKTYTFFLEEGHKFADGSEVDAEAVKFSFDRTLAIEKGPSSLYNIINETRVVDPYTVEFQLENEFPPFISTLAANYGSIINPKVMDHEEDADYGQNYLASNTMGSGPYMLEEYQKSQYYKLALNPNHPLDPELKTVYFQISSDTSGARMRLEKGEIDILEGLPVDQFSEVESVDGVKVLQSPSLAVEYVYMNIGKGNEVLKNKMFRQAISYAVDYQSFIDEIMAGYGTQFRGPVPEGLWGHNPDAFMYSRDLNKAKELLEESGVSDDVTLDLLYSDNNSQWEELALLLQNNLGEIGINVELTKVAYATMREQLDVGEFDLSLGVWSPDYADPYMFMNYWFDSDNWGLAGNRSFYENPEVDKLIREAASISDQEERIALYKEAQEIIVEDAAYVYLAQKDSMIPMREDVQGYVFNPMLEGIYNLADMSK
ncbi:ABC transporter substrate-binding protein [Virgibacillus litoralis]|uniref:Peptide/nickel transport system substrate-binding protein n=1 Tax=Virgibacillus litoralis TaxID=578221 RepID=A0ABS4HCY5_9BACI|nr:ABC transporter substrate-binding protein [Virgibacillus litoralis]MBP1948332.1 peptide/nickel transport system substrate-binding protein [Virgibacillus litoralis]